MVKNMGREHIHTRMVQDIRESGRMTIRMVKEYFFMLVETDMRVILLMEKEVEEVFITMLVEINTKVNIGEMIAMVRESCIL